MRLTVRLRAPPDILMLINILSQHKWHIVGQVRMLSAAVPAKAYSFVPYVVRWVRGELPRYSLAESSPYR
jgi:hypothetical protein